MKLERVVLKGFLSHRDTDWSPDGARLVTLVGANGAGKSGLASDALRYALFDVARAKTDELVQLGSTDMSVLVEFTFAGARYRVARGRTTKSGGRSFLELHVLNESEWTPLTGDTIRDTQAKIGELLRLDPDTFETAVLLGQGDANRFAEATAGERKRILGQVLGLEVYARAEARTRELARDVDTAIGIQRGRYDAAEGSIFALGDVDAILAGHRGAQAGHEAALAVQRSARNDVDQRIRELDAQMLAAAALGEEVTRLEGEHAELAEAWKAAHRRVGEARDAIAAAQGIVDAAAEVEAATAELPALRVEVDRLVALEAEDASLRRQLEEKRREVEKLRTPWQTALVAARTQRETATARVDRLVEQGKAATAVCETCGQPIGRDEVLRQLAAARKAVKAIVDPKQPSGLAVAEAQISRLESRIRETGHDAAALATVHRQVADLSALAGRAEGLEQARGSIARATKAIEEAEAEKTRLTEKGQALTVRLNEARVKSAATTPLQGERTTAVLQLNAIDAKIAELERSIQIGHQLVAKAEANVERRDQLREESTALASALVEANVELAQLRRLVAAFGPGGIPARIIEGVLPELGRYANELLAELRPGMALELRAQRAKKSGDGMVEALDLVVRDDVGERGLALFSGGERMSVSLALAVGLSRLVARRAGTAIRTLIVDEPDGLDAESRRAFGQALRVIAHRGELARVILVSHHQDLAEYGDSTYLVSKNGRGSEVELVS